MDESKLYLVFEYLFMDLKKYIDDQRKQNTRIDVGLTQSYMFQMLQEGVKNCRSFFSPNFKVLWFKLVKMRTQI